MGIPINKHLKNYTIAPVYKGMTESAEHKNIQAENSKEAAKIALEIFCKNSGDKVRVWRSESRRCHHVYTKDGPEWPNVFYGD